MRFQRPDKTKHTTPNPDQDRFVLVCTNWQDRSNFTPTAASPRPGCQISCFDRLTSPCPLWNHLSKLTAVKTEKMLPAPYFFQSQSGNRAVFAKYCKNLDRGGPRRVNQFCRGMICKRAHTHTRNTHADAGSSRSRFLLKISSKVLTLNETVAAAAHTSFKGRTKGKDLLFFCSRGGGIWADVLFLLSSSGDLAGGVVEAQPGNLPLGTSRTADALKIIEIIDWVRWNSI